MLAMSVIRETFLKQMFNLNAINRLFAFLNYSFSSSYQLFDWKDIVQNDHSEVIS